MDAELEEFKNPHLEVRPSKVPVADGVEPGKGLFAAADIEPGFLVSFPGCWVHRCHLASLEASGYYSFDLPQGELGSIEAPDATAEAVLAGQWPEDARCSLGYTTFPGCQANHVQSSTYRGKVVAEANCKMEVRLPYPTKEQEKA